MTILTNLAAGGLFVAALLASCSGAAPERVSPSRSGAPIAVPPAAVDAGVGLSEVQARQVLDAMFRDAGFRILNDEPLEESHIEVVLDGYDPEKKVGYEYISASEARESISESEADELARHWSLLILRSCSLAHLRRGASEFLARVPRARDAGVAEP